MLRQQRSGLQNVQEMAWKWLDRNLATEVTVNTKLRRKEDVKCGF